MNSIPVLKGQFIIFAAFKRPSCFLVLKQYLIMEYLFTNPVNHQLLRDHPNNTNAVHKNTTNEQNNYQIQTHVPQRHHILF